MGRGRVLFVEVVTAPLRWSEIVEVMTRPQPVTLPMVALFAIIPGYLVIGVMSARRTLNVPELPLDRLMPLQPAWSVVYLSLFLAVLLPVFVLHQQEIIRRTIFAFIFAWVLGFALFLAYPTVGPRPHAFAGEGFLSWMQMEIYAADAPYNCFPSLHVAQCFLAASALWCVHRGVGLVAGVWAFLVGLSTVYTKQHYVADVIGGMVLAAAAYALFLRRHPRDAIPERERQLAPVLAACGAAVYGLVVLVLWLAYELGGGKVY
jgi:membrane-associated phospholipid phosphatase